MSALGSVLTRLAEYRVPRDLEDDRYVLSHEVADADGIRAFFARYGFVVVRDVLSRAECDATIDEMLATLASERGGFKRDDPATWDRWPKAGMSKHGMPTRDPVFTPRILSNRQSPNLHAVFTTLLGTQEIMSNHDRMCFMRPTKNVHIGRDYVDKPTWATGRNLHLDLDPFTFYAPEMDEAKASALLRLTYSGKNMADFIRENNHVSVGMGEVNLQCTVNLADNVEADGGYQCVPGFVHVFADWERAVAGKMGKATPDPSRVDVSFNFPEEDPVQQFRMRIPMRAGSIVVWDQRTPHGSAPNNSDTPRFAHFLKMFPARTPTMDGRRSQLRAAAVARQIEVAGCEASITPLGAKVFGLVDWMADITQADVPGIIAGWAANAV